MTKKDELLLFIDEYLNSTNVLEVVEYHVETFTPATRRFYAPAQIVRDTILAEYNDDLVGSWPNDAVVSRFIDWRVIEKV